VNSNNSGTSRNVIELNQVTKRYKKLSAMDSVSYDVPAGCVFALLGENGAGKTTTIRTLLGLEVPDSGHVSVLGMDSRKDAVAIRRAIGYVPERPVLYDWMKVSQTGWFVSGFYPEGFLKRFHEFAEQFELPLDKKIKSLSKGMRAKVSLALAMSHDPDLLILDEPTSGLDTLVRRNFLESMVDLAATGKTVFLSSHQINEVERVADHVAIMSGGKILVCQPLVEMKQEMEQWVVSTEAQDLPEIEAEIIHSQWKNRQCRMMVRNPSGEALWKLRDHPSTIDVEVHVPSLEEIFVALIQGGKEPNESNQRSNEANAQSDRRAIS